MKTALILLVVMVACAAARSVDKQVIEKGLPCGRKNIGLKVTFFGSSRRYLECERSGWELKSCERGTWFSSEHKGCIGHEEENNCDPISESAESEEVITEAPISESVESEEIITEPPISESVESEEIITEPPISESVESEEIITEPPISESVESEEVVTEAPSSEEVVPTEPPVEPSSEEEGPGCEAHCSYLGEYLVNPVSCHSFYQCAYDHDHSLRAVLHDCPIMNNATGERLVFNPELDVCDWPTSYQCSGNPGCHQPEPEPECPAVKCDYLGQYFGNPSDCHSFYQCAWDHDHSLRAVLHNCAIENGSSRLVFNSKLDVCDWSWAVECKNSC